MSQERALEKPATPALWGGVECTVNRVGNHYRNQLLLNGHLERIDDLDRFARLGIRTLRFPLLWEGIAPHSLDMPDWSWADQRLERMRELAMTPVAGLVHHGSGPAYTSLIDPAFPHKLATFARMTAERYPWLTTFTPINEPLTTARFSGLYGHWYPHGRDDRVFVRSLLNQCAGTVAAMNSIRTVIPQAQLMVTEDAGRTYGAQLLSEQVRFDNQRRWLSLDLLCGRVDRDHPLYLWLITNGALPAELEAFVQAPVAPDIIGLNYYLTSDRLLDERLGLYPEQFHGGNGRQCYADVEAVRYHPEGIAGHRAIFKEAWQRYGRPLVMSEVHLGCTREEQVRWFMEAWQAGLQLLNQDHVDLRAVTAWSLLGAFDWNSLLTESNNHYEPGVFDVRGSSPRPTLLAGMLTSLTHAGSFQHPVLASPGWWRRTIRTPGAGDSSHQFEEMEQFPGAHPPLMIVGSSGTLGRAFARICRLRGIPHQLLSRSQMDIADGQSVTAALDQYRPWAVINAAGYVRVDQAEEEVAQCFRENALGPLVLAKACQARGMTMVTFSSDLVFDGDKDDAYQESDPVAPLNVYGRSKAEAEWRVLSAAPRSLIVRTSAFFGPWDSYNFITTALGALRNGEKVMAADDLNISPTYIPDLVNACLDLLLDGEHGIWHLANIGGLSWAELAHRSAVLAELNPSGVICCSGQSLGYRARRPRNSIISSERSLLLPPLEDALQRFFTEVETQV